LKRRPFARFLVYGIPVALWSIVLFVYSVGERGRYEVSWHLIQVALRTLAPEWGQISDGSIVSMYALNAAVRRVAHVASYAVLTLLLVRLIQSGAPRLKSASLLASVFVSAAYIALDELARRHEAHRHPHGIDIYLDLFGVVLMVGGTVAYFAMKTWERRLAETSVAMSNNTAGET
jgi:VanZ family protein